MISTFRQPVSPGLMAGAAEGAAQRPGPRAPPCAGPRPPPLWGPPRLSSRAPAPAPLPGQIVRPPRGRRPVAGEPLPPRSLQRNTLQKGDPAVPSPWGPFAVGPLQRKPALFLGFRAVGETHVVPVSVVTVGVD